MVSDLERVKAEALSAVREARTPSELQALRVRYLGRRGELTALLRGVGKLDPALRPEAGRLANEARQAVEAALEEREGALSEAGAGCGAETLDVTLPGRPVLLGRRHPVTRVRQEVEDIFLRMGFEVAEGPEVELDYYNFELLNMPPDHPARDMQDSFYVTPHILLRTHTSPVQLRYMRAHAPRLPVRIIVPGKVYRRDDDPTHAPMFTQVEGLVVDRGITLAHLKGVLEEFARAMFGAETRIRLRPSYFPFTEPSAEVDVSCTLCGGRGCRTCHNGWLEILGSGMVHPEVLRNGGYDPGKVTGFAFGMGVERVAMLKYGIDDLRHFFINDVRFLRQF
ncbi:MAG: phenylalanine--tRNA ligase subunit alpha [Acetobacteraceae bacterium]|nr:phenylalanine--tRNA ligase subunit alpha [Acetobacteraceae bacterium]